jgi:uncharacterized protein YndB with AHSA1/START domain
MKEVSRRIDASPEQIWAVLKDGWLYTGWVVGAAHIRAVDPSWPAVGSTLHHAVGAWPMQLKDSTSVLESEPNRRLVLQARGWPVGEARVEVILEPDGANTLVRMGETPTDGPGKWLHNPLQQKMLEARNREALARLASMAVGRAS